MDFIGWRYHLEFLEYHGYKGIECFERDRVRTMEIELEATLRIDNQHTEAKELLRLIKKIKSYY